MNDAPAAIAAWQVVYGKVEAKDGPFYRRELDNVLAFYRWAQPVLEAYKATHSVGIETASRPKPNCLTGIGAALRSWRSALPYRSLQKLNACAAFISTS